MSYKPRTKEEKRKRVEYNRKNYKVFAFKLYPSLDKDLIEYMAYLSATEDQRNCLCRIVRNLIKEGYRAKDEPMRLGGKNEFKIFPIKLNREGDQDVISYLETVPNKRAFICEQLRLDMLKNKDFMSRNESAPGIIAVAYRTTNFKPDMAYLECDDRQQAEQFIRDTVPGCRIIRSINMKKEAVPSDKAIIDVSKESVKESQKDKEKTVKKNKNRDVL